MSEKQPGTMIVELRIMPESPEEDLDRIINDAKKIIKKFTSNDDIKVSTKDVAFGLKSINIYIVLSEDFEDLEKLETELSNLNGVSRAETIDMRRALG